jgi:hypothetical protein
MPAVPKNAAFDATFAALRAILAPYGKTLLVQVDKPGDFQICARNKTDRIGRPLFVAAVQTKKNYVSYHLMPVYAYLDLVASLSPSLKKRMHGKGCFNFTVIEPAHVKELKTLTKTGIARFKNVEPPWAR